MAALPNIVVTLGEPAGVGPDLVLALAQRPPPADITVLADPELLAERAELLGLPFAPESADTNTSPKARLKADPKAGPNANIGRLRVATRRLPWRVEPGEPEPINSAWILRQLSEAVDGCLKGQYDAMVTCPVNKAVIASDDLPFTGHTEYLGKTCGVHPVMMLVVPESASASGPLRVALATTHLPLAEVAGALTRKRLRAALVTVDAELRRLFGIARPRIAVCGLNPHAGEDGRLGREDRDLIAPVVARLRQGGMRVAGPLPADTAFTPEQLAKCDAVLAMYHDQGLPVIKHAGFGKAVNVTLGLPFLRVSVDHGTAFDVAGTGRARPDSLFAAIDFAIETLARR